MRSEPAGGWARGVWAGRSAARQRGERHGRRPALPQPAHDCGTDLRIDRFDSADLAGGLLADVARRERCAELLALGGAPPAAALPGNGDAAHAGIAAAAIGLRLVRNDGGTGPLREVLELVRLLGHGTSSLSNRCSAGLHAKILG